MSNKGEINIQKIDSKFNTISGTITNAETSFGTQIDQTHPVSAKVTSFEFEHIPLQKVQ